MDLFAQFALAVTDECMKDYGINLKTTDLGKYDVIWETSISAIQSFDEDVLDFARDVDYISTHGTSTPVSECKAMCTVFETSLNKLNVSASKSMTGHLLGAMGAIEAIACVKVIKTGIIPPTINADEMDPAIDKRLNVTPNKAVKKEVNVVLNNTFGFGDHIFVSLFKRYKA